MSNAIDRDRHQRYLVNPDDPSEGTDVRIADADRPVYVYLIDGVPKVGTLDAYAHDVEQGSLVGVDVSTRLWFADGDDLRWTVPSFERSEYDDSDYATVGIFVGHKRDDGTYADEASYRIDGRA